MNDFGLLEIVLTASCNLRCAYCYQNQKSARAMSWETLRASLDLLLRSRREEVDVLFIGGEPLLEFPLIERAVRYVADAKPSVRVRYDIITNGLLLDRRHVDFFAEHDFDAQLSFDGIRPAQDLRGKQTFEVLDELLERLRRDHPRFFSKRLRVALTLLPQTICWLPDSVSYFLAKAVNEILIAPEMTAFSDWRVDQIHELDRAFAAVFDICIGHYRRTGQVPLGLFRKVNPNEIADRSPRDMCNVASGDKAAVDVDGQVLGCVTFAESYQRFPTAFLRNRLEALKMGSVQNDELAHRMAGYPAAARAAGLFTDKQNKYSSYGRCGECRFLAMCGICPVSIGHQPGNTDPNRVPDFLCAYNLVSQKYREQFPCIPTAPDILLGRAPVPELTRTLERLTTAGTAGVT